MDYDLLINFFFVSNSRQIRKRLVVQVTHHQSLKYHLSVSFLIIVFYNFFPVLNWTRMSLNLRVVINSIVRIINIEIIT